MLIRVYRTQWLEEEDIQEHGPSVGEATFFLLEL